MSDMSDFEDDQAGTAPSTVAEGSSSLYDPKRHAREQHNALERRRRDNIKDMYTSLREVVPETGGERVQASRAVILKKAIETIEKGQADASNLEVVVTEQEAKNARMREEVARLKAQKATAALAALVASLPPGSTGEGAFLAPTLPAPRRQHQ